MNIIEAIQDKNLFRNFLDEKGNLSSWLNWLIALKVLFGLPVRSKQERQLIYECTGRSADLLPKGFLTALFLVGRRSGKSRIAAVIGAYIAVLSGAEKKLSKGETGLVAILAPSKKQARVIKNYMRALFETPMLKNLVIRETQEGFELNNGIAIEILAGDWRSIRGYSLICCIVDEICFFGLDSESYVKSDTELIRAIRPSLATTNGRLICVSSPYAMRGWGYNQYKRHYGNDDSNVLIWNCGSRIMNPSLPQRIIDDAIAEDLQAAKSEYLGEWRDDVCLFLPREIIESAVVKNRLELMPRNNISYRAFVDISGGRSDDSCIGIAHKTDNMVVVDFAKQYKPPHSPYEVISSMCNELKRYNINSICGDYYSAEFLRQAFQSNGIRYDKSELNKSQIYLEFLPRLCSGVVELLDNEVLINQLSNLERKTRSGGRDIIDHAQGQHDDLANAVCGACISFNKKELIVGCW